MVVLINKKEIVTRGKLPRFDSALLWIPQSLAWEKPLGSMELGAHRV